MIPATRGSQRVPGLQRTLAHHSLSHEPPPLRVGFMICRSPGSGQAWQWPGRRTKVLLPPAQPSGPWRIEPDAGCLLTSQAAGRPRRSQVSPGHAGWDSEREEPR
jgi:hypothetical protein